MVRKQPTVVVLDDDDFIRESIRKTLHKMELNTKCFTSAEEALEWLKGNESSPALVIFDFLLPGKSGPEFLMDMRRMPVHSDVPAVALSGKRDRDLVLKALELRTRDILSKPLQPAILRKRLRCLKCPIDVDTAREVIAACPRNPQQEIFGDGGFRRFKNKGYKVYPVTLGKESYVVITDGQFSPSLLKKMDVATLRLVASVYLRDSSWIPVWPEASLSKVNIAKTEEGQWERNDPALLELLRSVGA